MASDKRRNAERQSILAAATVTGEQLLRGNLSSPLLTPALFAGPLK